MPSDGKTFEGSSTIEHEMPSSSMPDVGTVRAETPNTESSHNQNTTFQIDFDKDFDLTYTKPEWFSYSGHGKETVNKWSALYIKVMAALIKDYPHKFRSGMSFAQKTGRIDLASDDNYNFMITPKPIPGTAYMLETNLNSNSIAAKIRYVLDLCDVDYKNIVITYNGERQRARPKGKGAALADDDIPTTRYWVYAPDFDAVKWEEFQNKGIMGLGWQKLGNLKDYSSQEEMRKKMLEIYDCNSSMKNTSYATWQFCNDIKVGDVIFAKRGSSEILGRGIVASDYEYDEKRDDFNNIRKVNWTDNGHWTIDRRTPRKTLTDITQYTDIVKSMNALFEDANVVVDDEPEPEGKKEYPDYTRDNFLEEVYMEENDYLQLVEVLLNKKNIILQGAPGVGKTYAAKRLAYSIMGVKDIDRVMMVQFHQSYSYEDFIMGFRPAVNGFELKKGAFYTFCKKAEVDTDNKYFFIIDEINRGNLSKIFGELFMLLENDKRGISLQLLYSDEKFAVPENVYIIGMMNTADRSLAMLDYALRRRFAFIDMKPGFNTKGFRSYRDELDNTKFNRLIECVTSLNNAIASDESLGEGFCIGHSYFCNLNPETIDDNALSAIVEYELIPLLKEYWFDDAGKVEDWRRKLMDAVK